MATIGRTRLELRKLGLEPRVAPRPCQSSVVALHGARMKPSKQAFGRSPCSSPMTLSVSFFGSGGKRARARLMGWNSDLKFSRDEDDVEHDKFQALARRHAAF